VSPLTSAVLSQTSGRDTWSAEHLILTRIRENTTANALLTTKGVLVLQKQRALVTHSPDILPKYICLDLPCDVIHSTAHFRLCVHTLLFETVTWNQKHSPTCDLCDTDDIQDEQHVLFRCTKPHVISLRRKYVHLCFPQQEPTMCLLS
jgi:hypothetical protein